jgi:hypothetical protein
MTSFPVPANRPWFNNRAKLVSVPALSAPYQLRISLTRGVIVALLVAFMQQKLQAIPGMRDKRLLSVRFLLTLKRGTERNHIYPSQSNGGVKKVPYDWMEHQPRLWQ